MFRKQYKPRRSTNILFVIFRMGLSFVMFAILLAGVYSAYKHFSGLDPLKLDPQAVLKNLMAGQMPDQFGKLLSDFKLSPNILGKAALNPDQGKLGQNQPGLNVSAPAGAANPNVVFKFLVLSDSHGDNMDLEKVMSQTKQTYPDLKFIIGLGDYSKVGTVEELKEAKGYFDKSGLRYFLIPGDHDLWDCRNRQLYPTACFGEVFGPSYQSFSFEDFYFLLLDNSDNYTGFSKEQSDWITRELEKAKGSKGIFVFIHEPLFHPSSEKSMGWVESKLKNQAGALLFQLKDFSVSRVFAGDIHYFSEYQEPKTGIQMNTIGAVTIERNPQAPRYGVVSVFEDGSTKVEDVEIK